jgi:hypothetical protein
MGSDTGISCARVETARADAIASGEFVMPSDESALWHDPESQVRGAL